MRGLRYKPTGREAAGGPAARLGAARTPSPDVRCARPGLHSLDAACAPASMPPLASNAGSGARAAPRWVHDLHGIHV